MQVFKHKITLWRSSRNSNKNKNKIKFVGKSKAQGVKPGVYSLSKQASEREQHYSTGARTEALCCFSCFFFFSCCCLLRRQRWRRPTCGVVMGIVCWRERCKPSKPNKHTHTGGVSFHHYSCLCWRALHSIGERERERVI